MFTLRIHIRASGDHQLGNFHVTFLSRIMQMSPSKLILPIHIRTETQVLFDKLDVSLFDGLIHGLMNTK